MSDSTKFSNIVETPQGVRVQGLSNRDLLHSEAGTVRVEEKVEIDVEDNTIRLNPTEIIFTDPVYDLNDKSKIVYLFYSGSTDTTLTFSSNRTKQVVYVMNLTSTASVIAPGGAIEGDKIGHKYYFSQELGRWLFMGLFEFSVL